MTGVETQPPTAREREDDIKKEDHERILRLLSLDGHGAHDNEQQQPDKPLSGRLHEHAIQATVGGFPSAARDDHG